MKRATTSRANRLGSALVMTAAFLCAACDEGAGASASATASVSAAAAPTVDVSKAKKKKVTDAELTAAKKEVKPFQPFGAALGGLVGKLGAPHAIEGKDHVWAAVHGDKCSTLKVEKNGDQVGATSLVWVDKMMKKQHADCAKYVP